MRISAGMAFVVSCVMTQAAVALDDANDVVDRTHEVGDQDVVFDVYRQGDTRFGEHAVRFSRDGEDLIATNEIRLRAGLGPITVFRYEHDSTERWRDDELIGMRGRTFKDGNTYTVSVDSAEEAFLIEGVDPELMQFAAESAHSLLSSHWRGYPQGEVELINTEHGTFMDAEVVYLGETEIEGDGGMITVDHYRLISTLTVDLYYDQHGRWAGCEFDARGQSVRYVRRAP